MVKTSPIIVGVMEKSVPISDIKKEGFSKTGVESTPTTELDNELQRISDEFIAKEEKAAEEVSPIRAVSEVVTREADILSAFDKQCSKEVHEPSYLSDILKTVGDELKETASDGEGANISETLIKTDDHDQVMKTECGITKLESVVADEMIASEEFSDTVRDEKIKLTEDDAVIFGDLKSPSQENLLDRRAEVCKPLFSDEDQDKEIISIEESNNTGVIDYISDISQVNFADRKIQKSEPLNSNDKSESEILKDAELINNVKDVSKEKSEATKIQDFEPRISKVEGDISKVAVQISVEEGKKDIFNTIEKEIKPAEAIQSLPKVKEIQSETKPIITTPTLSRRGLGGSQRLSRDQRPPPLDVSHLTLSSEEGTDEDFDAAGYIVTEPVDEDVPKQQCQEDTIYRINSSPDILTEPPLRKVSSKAVPSVQVTEDIRDTVLSEFPTQIQEEVSVNEAEQAMAQVLQVQSDSDASEKVQKTGASGQVYIQPETQHSENTKPIVQPSVSMEKVIEEPLMAFDTVTELQIPTLVPIEHDEGEVQRHKPMFRIESDDSSDQGMEDIEALIEKANRELALEMERAGLKVPDADDDSDESPEEEESHFNVHIPEYEPETEEKEVFRTKESDSNQERKLRRVERRFERMASETLEKEAAAQGSSAPEVELHHEAEFERMVSQLSTEEVADCQREYLQLWDEGGLTPSEDWDSHDPDTPSGELEEDSTTASQPGTSV